MNNEQNNQSLTEAPDLTRRNLMTGGALALAGLAATGINQEVQAQTAVLTAGKAGRLAGKVALVTGGARGIGCRDDSEKLDENAAKE